MLNERNLKMDCRRGEAMSLDPRDSSLFILKFPSVHIKGLPYNMLNNSSNSSIPSFLPYVLIRANRIFSKIFFIVSFLSLLKKDV